MLAMRQNLDNMSGCERDNSEIASTIRRATYPGTADNDATVIRSRFATSFQGFAQPFAADGALGSNFPGALPRCLKRSGSILLLRWHTGILHRQGELRCVQ